MRPGNLLFSSVQFLIVLAVLGMGILALGLSYLPHLPLLLLEMFSDCSRFFAFAGYGMILLSLLLVWGFFVMHKGRYYQVRMKAPAFAQIDLPLIESYIERYWKDLFPQESVIKDVILYPNQKIEIVANLSHLSFPLQKQALERVERELGALLSRQLGYDRDFLLTILID